MKNRLAVTVALAVLVLGVLSASAYTPRMRVNVPFEFHAGNQIFPAGEYVVEFRGVGASATGSTILIMERNGVAVRLLQGMPGSNTNRPGSYLVFNRYGRQYFLAQVCQGNSEVAVRRSSAEREMALAHAQGRRAVTLAAVR